MVDSYICTKFGINLPGGLFLENTFFTDGRTDACATALALLTELSRAKHIGKVKTLKKEKYGLQIRMGSFPIKFGLDPYSSF